MDLKKLRDDLNKIDDQMLELLAQRRKLVRNVIEHKDRWDLQLRDVQREEQLLARLIGRGRQLGLDAHTVTSIFHEIIDDSVKSQQLYLQRNRNPDAAASLLVAYQGSEGDVSHLAAKKYFADREHVSTFVGHATFGEVIQAVEQGAAECGVLPVENTTAGVINEVYDLLLRTKLSIVGEEVLPIRHCLLATEEVPLSKIRRVLSQWQVLGECSLFLTRLENCHKEPVADTATAVRRLKEEQDLSQAAIAGEEAAHLNGLRVLERNIGDHPENLTRFIVVARKPVNVDLRIPAKTSLIIATPHEAGALMKSLVVMQRHGINLTKLESRPLKGSRFEYLFYMDFEGNISEQRVEEALVDLRSVTTFLKILGTYPSENREKTVPTVKTLVGPQAAVEQAGEVAPVQETADSRRSYRLASRETKASDTVLRIGDVQLGGKQLVIMAGPSVVESEQQILSCARQVVECGGQILYGGCFPAPSCPPGSPGSPWDGLQWLSNAGREYGLPVMTEVLNPADVERVAEWADILLIGPQNMHNLPLLHEVGGVHHAVLLKRGMAASLEQLLDAAESIMQRGNQQVMLCEHGISTFETTTRNTLDLGGISILKQRTHLPIVADPSHAAGQRDLVLPLALASRAVGSHALLIDVHPNPPQALHAGAETLDFDAFQRLLAALHA